MSPYTKPTLSEQRRFWNIWNATLRDPANLNQHTLRRGETIMGLVRSLALDNPTILDFGCGTGWLTERLAQFGPTTGIDLADDVIAAAQSRTPHIKFLAGDFFHTPVPSASYDIVISQEVIAHIPAQEAYLDRAAEVLKSRGYLIITTPNRFVMARSNLPPQPPEHIELWLRMATLKRLLRQRFRILHTLTIAPLGNRGVLRLINSYKINTALGLLVSRQDVEKLKERAGLGSTLIAVAQKKS